MKFLARLTPGFMILPMLALLLAAGCTTSKVAPGSAAAQAQKNQMVDGKPVLRMPQGNQAPAPVIASAQPRKVALLLPLSGPQADVGASLMKSSMMAVQELAPDSLQISVHDTSKGARSAFTAAQAEGAQAIIGPLFSADVQAIRNDAATSGVPVLALSNDNDLAGQNTYVMGFWPGAQITRVLTYAQKRGLRNIAVVIPDDAYGRKVEAALNTSITSPSRMITLVRVPPRGDHAKAVMQLAEVRGQYDALLMPIGGSQLFGLLQALGQQDLLKTANGRPVQLLGSGVWDEAELQRRPELQGAWYAAPDPTARLNFNTRYQRNFGEDPVRIASLSYDATALAAVLASRNWPYNAQALTQKQGFAGVDGLFRMRSDGLVDRGLAVLQFTPAGLTVLDPSPKQF